VELCKHCPNNPDAEKPYVKMVEVERVGSENHPDCVYCKRFTEFLRLLEAS